MVVAPRGTFQMGSPENESMRNDDEDDTPGAGGERVPITFKAPFAVAKSEISFAQWNVCLNDGGCKISSAPGKGEKDDQPAVNISWKDITGQYLPWLNRKVSGRDDGPYRLLSEAEWEYVARAGTSSPYWFGYSIGKGQAALNSTYTMPVNDLAANAWGLHHVHGNVWEWVQDRYVDSYKGVRGDGTSPPGISEGTRVVRGGSYTNDAGDLRSAKRLSVPSYSRVRDIGFRIARAPAL
jgi:formylglycine-generating enzyme required for sulfatase activity